MTGHWKVILLIPLIVSGCIEAPSELPSVADGPDPIEFDCIDCTAPVPIVLEPSWDVPAGERQLQITFDQPGAEDIDDFVALVDLQSSLLVRSEDAGAADLRFLDSDGDQLDHETEVFEASVGHLVAWVRLPTLSAAGDTRVQLVFGGTEDFSVDPSDVWQDFEMVFHLGDDIDSAGGEDADNHGAKAVAGRIGQARSFDGLEQYIDTNNKTDLDTWSLSLWVQAPDGPMSSDGPNGPLMREGNYQVLWDHSDDRLVGAAAVKTGRDVFDASFGTLTGGQWLHLAATFDGEELKSYRDGELVTVNEMPNGNAAHSRESATIGRTAKQNNEPFAFFAGLVDEVRVYDGVQSPEFYEASFRNQTAPDAFYSITIVDAP